MSFISTKNIEAKDLNHVEFESDVDMVIVPNAAQLLHRGTFAYDRSVKVFNKLCEMNNVSFNPEEVLVLVRMRNNSCDNILCDSPMVSVNGIKYAIKFPTGEYIPKNIAKQVHENLTAIVKIPVVLNFCDLCNSPVRESIDATLVAHVTPNNSLRKL